MIVVVGGGLVAVTAAQSLMDQGHDVMLTTAHAEFGFPHGGCGLWDTSVINWPLQTLEEAVAAQDGSHITCRSQWLVKRLVHLFTEAGGRTSTRVRLQQLEGEWHATGTGTVPLDDVHHVLLADQDVTEPSLGVGLPLLSHAQDCIWYGAVVAEGAAVDAEHMGQRADGSTETWTTEASELDALKPFTLESMTMAWDEADGPLNAARCAHRAIEAVQELMASGRLDGA